MYYNGRENRGCSADDINSIYKGRVGKYLAKSEDDLQFYRISKSETGASIVGVKTSDGDGKEVKFVNFAQSTTLHGLRYIADGERFNSRRFLWLLCLLAALVLFIYQASDRTLIYFKHESNVNIEVMYARSLEFPSVTICNNNNFRISQAVELGLYEYLDEVFGILEEEEVNSTYENKFQLNEQDLSSVLMKLAHQKEDLIDSCIWKGSPCDLEDEIKVALMNYGVCYTIKFANNAVHTAGSDGALKLTLNIEQYEYMAGPRDEAGAKIILHGDDEEPLAHYQGFDVSPGTHTLVAVSREERFMLPEPYGDCKTDAEHRSKCLIDCGVLEVAERCGCRDYYYHQPLYDYNGTEVPPCTVKDKFTCVKSLTDEVDTDNLTCDCWSPCDYEIYTWTVSNAQVSEKSLNKFWFSKPQKQDLVKGKMYQAVETLGAIRRQNNSVDRFLEEAHGYFEDSIEASDLFKRITIGIQLFDANIRSAKQKLNEQENDGQEVFNITEMTGSPRDALDSLEKTLKGLEARCWEVSSLVTQNVELWGNIENLLNENDTNSSGKKRSKFGIFKSVNSVNFNETLSQFNRLASKMIESSTELILFSDNATHLMEKLADQSDHELNVTVSEYIDYPSYLVVGSRKTGFSSRFAIARPKRQIHSLSQFSYFVKIFFTNVKQEVVVFHNSTADRLSRLREEFAIMKKRVRLFVESNAPNDSFFNKNYAKVDIFYKDLSYTRVRQKVSFSFFSLLGEIGGFLGLLLGASILTVCELVDYLLTLCCRRCGNNQRKGCKNKPDTPQREILF